MIFSMPRSQSRRSLLESYACFDTGDGPSDAVLCRGSSSRATSRTTYTQHDLSSTVTSAEDAAMKAGEAARRSPGRRTMLIPKRRPGTCITANSRAVLTHGRESTRDCGVGLTPRGQCCPDPGCEDGRRNRGPAAELAAQTDGPRSSIGPWCMRRRPKL